MVSFLARLQAIQIDSGLNQRQFAKKIGYSAGYLCDIEKGRRLPSVTVVDTICDSFGFSQKRRREWHKAGAYAHGWDIL